VVISSYYNAADPRDEWSELLVVADNTNMNGWKFQDNNSTQTLWQTAIVFTNPNFWHNMRAGTVILIWHRMVGSNGVAHPIDVNKDEGYIEVSANDSTYFSGGKFGTAPLFADSTLNITAAGDVLVLQDSLATFVHALGHKAAFGSSWASLPLPKLNEKMGITDGTAVIVCPGSKLVEYGDTVPQDGTTWTSTESGASITRGLPNSCAASSTANSHFWRELRQPDWTLPTLSGTVNNGNTQVTLTWNAAVDPNPADGTQGYLLLRDTVNTFSTPLDGHSYAIGEILGGASVIALINSSQTLSYIDANTVPCPEGFYYRIYAFRYKQDSLYGNDYNVARGTAYLDTIFGSASVTGSLPLAPVSASVDRNNFCADDAGDITLSASGGSGTTLNWYSASCGGTLVGSGSGTTNSITIPSPTVSTTYFARWENSCGFSTCATVAVTVVSAVTVAVSIIATPGDTVCTGDTVTYTASSTTGGTNPSYVWYFNGIAVVGNSATWSNVPKDGDSIFCIITSSLSCATDSTATSNIIVMTVIDSLPVSVSISANPGDTVCAGDTVTYTAMPLNEGSNAGYQWFLNGSSVGNNSKNWSNVPANGDKIWCTVTSGFSCATNNPATSNIITMRIMDSLPLSVTIAADPGDSVCAGTTITYTATPVNGGANPSYEWFLNGSPVGSSKTWSNVPANGDRIWCTVTPAFSCTTNNTASSNSLSILLKVCETVMYVPDAFTPDGNGLNDEFRVVTLQEGITSFSMWVFNRWGEVVFESSDIHQGWNGKVNGSIAAPGTYAWKIVYKVSSQTDPSGSTTTLHGTVNLIR
jgi:gliding motility-associated-like protein